MKRLTRLVVVGAAVFAVAIVGLFVQSEERFVNTEATLDAPVSAVWSALADTGRYREWNPHLLDLQGDWQTGSTLRVTMQVPDHEPLRFDARVLGAKPEYELRWVADLPIPRMLTLKQKLIMTSDESGRTRLRNEAEFKGLLVGPVLDSVLEWYRAQLEAWNAALEEQIEGAK